MWFERSFRQGTKKNGLASRYFNYEGNTFVTQLEACLSTLFLVYSNRLVPTASLLDAFYAKQEADGAIRGAYSESDGSPLVSDDNPQGVASPLFASCPTTSKDQRSP